MIKKWTNFYGAHPLQPVLMLAGLVVAGYAVLRVSGDGSWMRILIWFFAAVIAHDLVLFPLYAAVDGLLVRLVSRRGPMKHRTAKHRTAKHGPVKCGPVKHGTVNYVRLPVLATGLTFLIFLPGIIEQGAVTYHNATLLTQAPYLHRWLLLVAGFFVVSALVFAVRRLPFGGRMRADEPSVGAEPGEVAHPVQ